ncbi:MAG: hypothetical protein ACJAQ6_002570 [Arenicella sp.]|jgi:hypothetical protein
MDKRASLSPFLTPLLAYVLVTEGDISSISFDGT